jgi:hypothetical protein
MLMMQRRKKPCAVSASTECPLLSAQITLEDTTMTIQTDHQALRADARRYCHAVSFKAALERIGERNALATMVTTMTAEELRRGMAADAMLVTLSLWDMADAEAAQGDMPACNATLDRACLISLYAMSFFRDAEAASLH